MPRRPGTPLSAAEHAQRCAASQRARRVKLGVRKPRRWKGLALEQMRAAYELRAVKVDDLAAYFGTSRGHMMRLAKRHGWNRRSPGFLPPAAHRHRYKYIEARRWFGRAFALEVVTGMT